MLFYTPPTVPVLHMCTCMYEAISHKLSILVVSAVDSKLLDFVTMSLHSLSPKYLIARFVPHLSVQRNFSLAAISCFSNDVNH